MGGLGYLLTQILSGRPPDNSEMVIQSDLPTVNPISDKALQVRLNLKLAGCAAHSRRPFAQYEDDDPDLCAWILHCFKWLSIYEGAVDSFG